VRLRLIGVMRPASQLKIPGRRRAAFGKRHDVMELEEATLGAPAGAADEGALPGVASPHLAPDGRGHVARRDL